MATPVPASPAQWASPAPGALRWGIALAAIAIGLALRAVMQPWIGDRLPFITMFGAVAAAAWFAGTAPAILAGVVGFVASTWLFRGATWLRFPWEETHWFTLGGYLLSVGVIIGFGHAMHRARARAEAETGRCRRAEAEAEAGRHRLEVTLRSIGDGVLVCDTEGRVVTLNPVAQRLTGWAEHEARGRPLPEVFDIVNETSGEPVENPALRALQEGVTVGLANHTELRPREGKAVPIEDSAAPIVGEDGRAVGAVLVFRDARAQREVLSERLRIEASLRQSEAQARLALDIARLGTWSWDVAADVVQADARTREIAGLPDEASAPNFRLADVIGRIDDGDWARVEASLSAALLPDSDGRYAEEFRFTGAAGEPPRWVLAHGQALYDPAGPARRVTRVLGSLLDITERKRSEQALAEADRRKDEFIATLAHELRNPLAPLRNGVHLLRILIGQGGEGTAESTAKPLAIMERQIGHMVRLIDDLLDLARVSGGKLQLQRHRIDIADAVRDAVETSQAPIQAAGHQLTVVLPTQPLYIEADVTRICQVIANLLNNAAKYTPEGGRIRVSVETPEPGWVEVSVEDNGRGLAPEMLPKIFQMFAQVDREAGRSAGGLGIGLAIARRLVQMHGGELRASSPGLGHGSSFIVRLPRADDDAAGGSWSADGAASSRAAASGLDVQLWVAGPEGQLRTGCRVLIADDNADGADSLNNLVQLMGYTTCVARDGGEAYRMAEAQRPDVALLDIGMPELDGYQVARRIRAQPWGRAMKLVALTGWGQDSDRRASTEAGFDLHWVKPVDPAELDALVESVAAWRAAADDGSTPARA